MSASTFPSLLRRSNIASYDPLITRIYTAPSAAQARGDWGLKASLPPPRAGRASARMIKVGALDAPSVGCEYRAGEREGRFVQRWGSGRVGWTGKGSGMGGDDALSAGFSPQRSSLAYGSAGSISKDALTKVPSTPAAQGSWMPDVEAMTEREFQAYLEELRARRPELENAIRAQDVKYRNLAQHYGTRMGQIEPSRFVANSATAKLAAPESSALHPVPHARGGLAYAHHTTSARDRDPGMALPGRGLNPAPSEHRGGYDAARRAASGSSAANKDTGATIVGVGGLTGSTSGNMRAQSIRSSNRGATGQVSTVVQGEDPTRSVQRFRLSHAGITSLPRVVASSPAAALRRELDPESAISWSAQRQRGQRPSPLEKARFEVGFVPAREADARLAASMGRARAVGDREWVAHAYTSPTDAMIAGTNAPASRGRAAPRTPVDFRQTRDKLNDILATLKKRTPDASETSAAPGGARSFSTSARRAADKPTANVPVGSEAGEGGISGPGIGGTQDPAEAPVDDKVQKDDGKAAGDGLAGGKWRQLEENVGGEVRYGNDKAGGKGE